ncbi:acyltransferase [bacterium 210820-DFI.6.37]|nr:acyltransferase [bacterium 210820-DFI.6.37]
MTIERLWHSFRIALIRSGKRRADYCRKHKLFRHIGEDVHFQMRKLPLYSELISIHDNVKFASRVHFLTHDITYSMLNNPCFEKGSHSVQERIGCIEIMDNVFIGAGVTILYDVRIGSNVIVAADSVVTKDLQPNSVYAGVPARKIDSIDEYLKKLKKLNGYPEELRPYRQRISQKLADYMWENFERERK